MDQPDGLIHVLLAPGATVSDRDDAAMDLAQFDDPAALAALLRVGSDEAEHEVVLSSVGEAIAEILMRNGSTSCPGVEDLASPAQREFNSFVRREPG